MNKNLFRKGLVFVIVGLFVIVSITAVADTHWSRGVQEKTANGISSVIYDWPMFHHDNMHTGYTDGTGNISHPAEKWSYKTGDLVDSSPALGDIDNDGIVEVVVGSRDNKVYALDGLTGDVDWSFETGDSVRSSPALGDIDNDGIVEVVVGYYDGNVYALDGLTGDVDWSFETGNWVASSPALGDIDNDGIVEVVVGSRDNKVYALDGLTGDVDWSFETGNWVESSPALGDIDNDGIVEVVVGYYDGNVYALDGVNGELDWSFETGNWVESSPALGDIDNDGIVEVVVGYYDGNVYALDGVNGELDWSFETGNWVESSPALGDIDNDGKVEVVVGSDDHKVYALDSDDIAPCVELVKPRAGFLYLFDNEAGKTEDHSFLRQLCDDGETIIFDKITVQVDASDIGSGVDHVLIYIDGDLKATLPDRDPSGYHEWLWNEHIPVFGNHMHTIKAVAYDKAGYSESDEVEVWIWNL